MSNNNLSTNTQTPQKQPQPLSLPLDGFSRAKQLLPFLAIGESTLWAWVKQGRFVQPIKLSPTITVWANKDVHAWFNEQRQKGQAGNPVIYRDNNIVD